MEGFERTAMDKTTNIEQKPTAPVVRTEAEIEENEQEIDLAALFYRFLEKIHWILITAFVAAGITAAVVMFLVTPIYEATAKIYIVGSDTTISLTDLQIGSNLAADY